MSNGFRPASPLTLAAAAVLALTISAGAVAFDAPRRKSGLWEMKTSMEGMPAGMGAMQVCVDEKSDDITRQQAQADTKKMCSQNDIKRDGDRTLLHSVCTFDKTTATTDAVFTGKFDSGYRADMHTTYDPPMMGRKESKMSIEAKWLGPCKEGQKAGDVMINGMSFNPAMMKGKRPQ
jgi:hypothetical protein